MTQRILIPMQLVLFLLVRGGAVHANAQTLGTLEDELAIRSLMVATTEAFSRHDAREFVGYYTSDADLVTVRGERMKGASEIEQGLSAIFATRAGSATLRTLDMSIRFLRADIAIVHVTNELSGLVDRNGQVLAPHRELSIRVVVKEQDEWLVSAFHNTMVNPF